jgi:hypothetical protein
MQVLFDDLKYRDIQTCAQREHITVAEWVRQVLRRARSEQTHTVESKLRGVSRAACHTYPSGDIDQILEEIVQGQTID